jgi:unsaturated rhamnogalacturonyl hydrolase
MQEQEVARKLELCVGSFKKVLYEPDDIFLKNMEKNNLAGDDISKYQLWEWTQGVGLYGLWKLFERTKDGRYLATLREYYDARIADGLPGKNINTMAPVLALSYLYEYTGDETYGASGSWTAFPKQRKAAFSTSRPIRSTTANCGMTRCS